MAFSVIVPWRTDNGWRQTLWDWNKARWQAFFPEAEIIEADSGQEPFSRGESRNRAVSRATNDLLVIADADTIANPPAITTALELAEKGQWVIPYSEDRYYNLNAETTHIVIQSFRPQATFPEPMPGCWDHKITSWAGMIVLHRNAFDAVGGYDKRFKGWGYEDNDFRLALDAIWSPHVRVDGFVAHLWHPVGESDAFGQPHIGANRALHVQYEHSAGNPARMRKLINAQHN